MIKRIEAREIMTKVVEERRMAHQQVIKDFCETVVDSKVREAAHEGIGYTIIECNAEDRENIADYLRVECGYNAYHIGFNKIEVHW